MNAQLLQELNAEIQTTETRLRALLAARSALFDSPNGDAQPPAPSPATAIPVAFAAPGGKERQRAPKGFLQAAILKVMAAAAPVELGTRDVRKQLEQGGYPYSLADLQKTVSEMARAKLLTMKTNGPWSKYALKAKAARR